MSTSILPEGAQQLVLNAVIDQLIGRLNDNPVVGSLSERRDQLIKRLNEIDREVDDLQTEGNRRVLEIQSQTNQKVDELQKEARRLVSEVLGMADNILTPAGLESALTALRGAV